MKKIFTQSHNYWHTTNIPRKYSWYTNQLIFIATRALQMIPYATGEWHRFPMCPFSTNSVCQYRKPHRIYPFLVAWKSKYILIVWKKKCKNKCSNIVYIISLTDAICNKLMQEFIKKFVDSFHQIAESYHF